MSTLLSVVVPARNSAPWIEELLESVLAQGIDAFEVLVVDNGSTDGTGAVVESVAARDQRVRLVASTASTAAEARNAGVDAAVGAFLAFADSDDIVPDGAYRRMLDSLSASGSDMAIGDHLKFSSTRTWSPTERWSLFEQERTAVIPRSVPALLTGRACWNRMFRRSFWDAAGLRFPPIATVDDIEPMTRALVSAGSVDVVPVCVYLYRDRSSAGSLSDRSAADTTVRYFEQERICAGLVSEDPALLDQLAEMVFDADGWAHLNGFLAGAPDDAAIARVARAVDALARVLPVHALERAAPLRRTLWSLVQLGAWSAAARFAAGSASRAPRDRLDAWNGAASVMAEATDTPASSLLAPFVEFGLLPAFVNDADAVAADWLASILPLPAALPLDSAREGLRAAMADALRSARADRVAAVSALRHVVPLVVGSVRGQEDGLVLSGPWAAPMPTVEGAELVLTSGDHPEQFRSRVELDGAGSWTCRVRAAEVPKGRWSVNFRLTIDDRFWPVVTSRMPLPPLGPAFPMQPLADRKDGWRFLVDRREVPRRGLSALLSRAARKLR